MYLCLNFLFIFRMPGRFICIGKMLILWFLGYEVLSISHTIDVSASCYFFVLVFSLHHFAFKLVLFYCIIMCKHFFFDGNGGRGSPPCYISRSFWELIKTIVSAGLQSSACDRRQRHRRASSLQVSISRRRDGSMFLKTTSCRCFHSCQAHSNRKVW